MTKRDEHLQWAKTLTQSGATGFDRLPPGLDEFEAKRILKQLGYSIISTDNAGWIIKKLPKE